MNEFFYGNGAADCYASGKASVRGEWQAKVLRAAGIKDGPGKTGKANVPEQNQVME